MTGSALMEGPRIMAEQKVVQMNDSDVGDETDAKKAPTARCLSELVSVTMSKAAARLSSVDEDPIFREATVRAAIRDFAVALKQQFPEMRDALPDFLSNAAAEIAPGQSQNNGKTVAARLRPAGGSPYAEHSGPSGSSGG